MHTRDQHSRETLLVGPLIEPVTVKECKDHLRIVIDDDDALIGAYIRMAREYVETFTRRALCTQVWRSYMDGGWFGWPLVDGFRKSIELRHTPVQSVIQFQYIGQSGTSPITLFEGDPAAGTGDFLLDTVSTPARVSPQFPKFWPATRLIPNAMWIDYVAGYAFGGALVTVASDGVSVTWQSGQKFAPGLAAVNIAGVSYPVASEVDPSHLVLASTAAVGANQTFSTGNDCAAVPESLKVAIKAYVGHWYENREPVITGLRAAAIEIPQHLEALLWSKRVLP